MNSTSISIPSKTSSTITPEIRPYNVIELCTLYKISYRTFSRWMSEARNEIGKRPGRYYTIQQVEKIFHEFGKPHV